MSSSDAPPATASTTSNHDHFVTTPNVVTEDPCGNIDNNSWVKYMARLMVGAIPGDDKDDKVTTTMC